jgi:uncharacterized protein YciI
MHHRTRRSLTLAAAALSFTIAALTTAAQEQKPPPKMSQFIVGLLYKGSSWTAVQTDEGRKLQAAHRANIDRLVAAGSMALAGPFDGAGDLRGLFVFNVTSIAEAQRLIETDPAIAAQQLRVDLYSWYGPAAIANVVEQSRPAPVH